MRIDYDGLPDLLSIAALWRRHNIMAHIFTVCKRLEYIGI